MIGCVYLPYFAAAVERRDDPSLTGAPLVIVERAGGSARVLAACGQATGLGVKPGMALRQARLVCPQARIIPADPSRYRHTFDRLLEALVAFSPRVEPGEMLPAAVAWLDMGSLREGEAGEMARALGRAVRAAVGPSPALGLAGGKLPACVAAASTEPGKARIIPLNRQAEFLAPFPVSTLPLDAETARRLELFGIRTLGQLAALPAGAVAAQFGAQGHLLHQLARGRDERLVIPFCPPAVESAARRFEEPLADRAGLEAVARETAGELAARLRASGLAGRELRLVLEMEDGAIHQESLVLRQPTGDVVRLGRVAGELLGQAYLTCGVSTLQLTMTSLVPAVGEQLDLFVHQSGQEDRLRAGLNDLVARHGAACFYQVALLDQSAPLPERRFRLQKVGGT
jgi:nucleotidyltransferase/DNA polymerase involved in DNA repair